MSGFAGFTGFGPDENENARAIVGEMLALIVHRGPDLAGEYVGDGAALGYRRLFSDGPVLARTPGASRNVPVPGAAGSGRGSGLNPDRLEDEGQPVIGETAGQPVIDETAGQPVFNEDGTLVLVMDGEIYNYESLKEDLAAKGHVFRAGTDAETVLHAYEEHGEKLTALLRGVFAFAIYDIPKRRLFCARDFFGVKPFYYCRYAKEGQSGPGFMFASEIKAFFAHPDFKKELNETALESYLSFQYSVHDETFFKGVYKLPPGHTLVLENGEAVLTRYFDPRYDPVEMTLESAVTAIDNAVSDSVGLQSRYSAAKSGSFLSGGVDSGFLAAASGAEKTFTVGFGYDKYDETAYAKELSGKLGAEHFSRVITAEEYWGSLPDVMYHMDEPLADPACVALYFASKLAKKHVDVALSGEASDEFFGGYNIYKEPLDLRVLTALPRPVRRFLGKIAALLPARIRGRNFFIRGGMDVEERFIGNARIFGKKERDAILRSPGKAPAPEEVTRPYYDGFGGYDDITKMQALDVRLFMVGDILLNADRMTMAHSLGTRLPLMDREVFKVASRLPTKYRVNRTDTKYAFRRAAAGHIPPEVAWRKKLGFPVPTRVWLKEDRYFEKVRASFKSETAERYFHTERLVELLDAHKSGKADNGRKIWTVYVFLVWYERMFGGTYTG
ncbi:MAG: asparagine synthase (glutamine-hydrolyzing) [Firmicutes bacterium]|nr:asparagine synthase (glutamine-hydrolyzing) [Bacillota bacterium]